MSVPLTSTRTHTKTIVCVRTARVWMDWLHSGVAKVYVYRCVLKVCSWQCTLRMCTVFTRCGAQQVLVAIAVFLAPAMFGCVVSVSWAACVRVT
jgi:hypothetical protein